MHQPPLIDNKIIKRISLPLALFVFALGVRLIYLWEFQKNPLFDVFPDSLDHFNFDQAAINFANGDLLARAVNNSFAPLYKYFLGTLYWLFGRNLHIVYLSQFCMGAFSCVLLYHIGRNLFGFREGVFASLGLALYSTHIIYEGIILRAAFISFLGVLSFYLLLRLKEHPGRKRLLWTTLSLSLFFQARPNTLLCLPLICIFLHQEIFPALSPRKPSAQWKIFFAILLASFTPLLIQCYLVHGKFVFFDASGPHTFISGNVVDYAGVGFDHQIIQNFRKNQILEYASSISFLIGHITENPANFLFLYVRKLFFFLNDFEAPTNISVYMFRDFSNFLQYSLNHYALIISLALIGIAASWKERKRLFLLFAYTLSLSVAILIFLNEARYRIPVVPFFILFAGKGLEEIITTFNRKQIKRLTILTAIFTVLFSALSEPKGMVKFRSNDYGNLGNAYIKLDQWGKAQQAFQASVKTDPNNPYAHINLGRILARLNKRSEAALEFKQADALAPDQWQTHYNLGILSSHSGRWQEAKHHLLLAWKMTNYPEVAFHLGDLYGRMSHHKKAIKFLEKFLKHKPNQTDARFLLGVEYEMNGESEKAISTLSQTVEVEPGHIQAWNNLGTIYSKLGRLEEAQKSFQTALDIDPNFDTARINLNAVKKNIRTK